MVEMIGISGPNKNLSDAEVLKAMQTPKVQVTFQNMTHNLPDELKKKNDSVFTVMYNAGIPTRPPQVPFILFLGPQDFEALFLPIDSI